MESICGVPLPFGAVAQVRWIAAQLSQALKALHGLHLIHRDVKAHNVLYRASGYLVLADFGLSSSLTADPAELCRRVGTKGYFAPEVVRKEPQGPAADWWSTGVLLTYAATGHHPFKKTAATAGSGGVGGVEMVRKESGAAREEMPAQEEEEETNQRILHAPIEVVLQVLETERSLHAFLAGLLQREPLRRLGAASSEEVEAHAFLAPHVDFSLMRRQLMPAPWKPDPQLIYAKDMVEPFSKEGSSIAEEADRHAAGLADAPAAHGEEQRRVATGPLQPLGALSTTRPSSVLEPGRIAGVVCTPRIEGWAYTCNPQAFERELAELARKSSAIALLEADEPPTAGGRMPSRWHAILHKRRRNARFRTRCAAFVIVAVVAAMLGANFSRMVSLVVPGSTQDDQFGRPVECVEDEAGIALVCYHECSQENRPGQPTGSVIHRNCTTGDEVADDRCEGHGALPWPASRPWNVC